jgi:hypothetical protein
VCRFGVKLGHLKFQESVMPQGDKSSYSGKQKRKAEHIEEGYEKKGVGKGEAERRAWATVNKQEGGAAKKKSSSSSSSSSSGNKK